MKKIPNLDTLRFIAASLVIIHHIELYKAAFFLNSFANTAFIKVIGKLGVVLFFVLSGFLITTLLLNEKEIKKKISFKKFYIRRILRIWPLYYLIVFFGFFVWPNIAFLQFPNHEHLIEKVSSPLNFSFYLTIFANVGWAVFGNIPFTSQTWSLATEEQFYLLWPAIINYFNKRLLPVMVLVILLYHASLYFLWSRYSDMIPFREHFLGFLYAFNINCMAIGGIFAVLIYRKHKIVNIIFNKYFFIGITIGTIILLLLGKKFGNVHYDVYSILFGIIISNLAFNEKYSTVLENKVTNYLGSISYGLYMYHAITLVVAIKLSIFFNSPWIIYPLTFGMVIFVSHFSFKYFESYFLRYKEKFQNL